MSVLFQKHFFSKKLRICDKNLVGAAEQAAITDKPSNKSLLGNYAINQEKN